MGRTLNPHSNLLLHLSIPNPNKSPTHLSPSPPQLLPWLQLLLSNSDPNTEPSTTLLSSTSSPPHPPLLLTPPLINTHPPLHPNPNPNPNSHFLPISLMSKLVSNNNKDPFPHFLQGTPQSHPNLQTL